MTKKWLIFFSFLSIKRSLQKNIFLHLFKVHERVSFLCKKKQTHNNFLSANFAIKKSYFLEIKLEINKKESKSNKTVSYHKNKEYEENCTWNWIKWVPGGEIRNPIYTKVMDNLLRVNPDLKIRHIFPHSRKITKILFLF